MEPNPYPLSWIDDYFPRLSYSIRGGVQDWLDVVQQCPRVAIAQTARGRPNMICDLMGQRAREAFADIPDEVEVRTVYETAQIRFLHHGVTMKFNQMDDEFRVHPPNTVRAAGWVHQQHLLPFMGQSESTDGLSLFGGYRLDGEQLIHVTATCQHGEAVVWQRDIPEPPAGDQFSLVQPVAPTGGPLVSDVDDAAEAEGA